MYYTFFHIHPTQYHKEKVYLPSITYDGMSEACKEYDMKIMRIIMLRILWILGAILSQGKHW